MIQITPTFFIDERELRLVFIRASGPGGQHVNKVATAVQLRFDVLASPSLSEEIRRRLIRLAGRRISTSGILIIEAQRFRTQERNRQDAIDRFKELLRKAAERPKSRIRTRPSASSRMRRLAMKRHRSDLKRTRRPPERN